MAEIVSVAVAIVTDVIVPSCKWLYINCEDCVNKSRATEMADAAKKADKAALKRCKQLYGNLEEQIHNNFENFINESQKNYINKNTTGHLCYVFSDSNYNSSNISHNFMYNNEFISADTWYENVCKNYNNFINLHTKNPDKLEESKKYKDIGNFSKIDEIGFVKNIINKVFREYKLYHDCNVDIIVANDILYVYICIPKRFINEIKL